VGVTAGTRLGVYLVIAQIGDGCRPVWTPSRSNWRPPQVLWYIAAAMTFDHRLAGMITPIGIIVAGIRVGRGRVM
jgi:hypothetical protein